MQKPIKGGPFVVALTKLRGHLRTCYQCKGIVVGGPLASMCEEGVLLTHKMALAANSLARQHGQAHRSKGNLIYPCPDVTLHGLAYSSTAQPHLATAVQTELF